MVAHPVLRRTIALRTRQKVGGVLFMQVFALGVVLCCYGRLADGQHQHDGRVRAFSVPTPENTRDAAPRSVLRSVRSLDFSQADLDLQPNPKEWLSPTSDAYKLERQEAGTAPKDCYDLLKNATKQEDGTYIIWNPPEPWLPPKNGVQGHVRTYLVLENVEGSDCKPQQVGFEIDSWMLDKNNLPGVIETMDIKENNTFCAYFGGWINAQHCEQPYIRNYFSLPGAGTKYQPFKTLQLDWEPMGHAPDSIYSVPHFDYHFYFVEPEAVKNISHGPCSMVGLLSQESYYRALKPMPLQCYPTGAYVNSGLAVAEMGTHLVNAGGYEFIPPFHGFDSTHIYGSYDGRMVFLEVMASARFMKEVVDKGKKLCRSVDGRPKEFYFPGFKPTKYCMVPSDTNVTRIYYEDFTWYNSGCEVTAATIFAPDSYVPPIQEAQLLNPECTFPIMPPLIQVIAQQANQALQRKVPPTSAIQALKEHMLQTQVSLSEDLRYWITPRDPEWFQNIQWLPLVQGG
eukprot:jgi/Botrbrau1/18207/Bobra.53_1s0066.1